MFAFVNVTNTKKLLGRLQTGVLGDRTPYENVRDFKWLYIGLKQLEIEGKPDAVQNKVVNQKQETKHFLEKN